jgi:CRP-like cAMP-binding protein
MSLESDLKDLVRIPLLATLEREALRLLAFSAETRAFSPGETIFETGDSADCGYFLLKGSVRLQTSNTNEPARILHAPALLGEMALLTETERSVTAIAETTLTTLRVPRALFHRVLKEHPRSASDLHAFVSRRLTNFDDDLRVARREFAGIEEI